MATKTTSASEAITPAMRDRQARGRDPYSAVKDSADGGGEGDMGVIVDRGQRVRKHHETWEQKEKTGFATRVLANPDLLLWHAQAKGDSVTAQRLRFTAMLCGYEDYYETDMQVGMGAGTPARPPAGASSVASGPGTRQ